MINFSQFNKKATRSTAQKPASQFKINFRIPKPNGENSFPQMSVQTLNDYHHPILIQQNQSSRRHAQSQQEKTRLEFQYISFKLKPTKLFETCAKKTSSAYKNDCNFYKENSPLKQAKERQRKEQIYSLAKSPQFYCKKNSQSSIKFEQDSQNQVPNFQKFSFQKIMINNHRNEPKKLPFVNEKQVTLSKNAYFQNFDKNSTQSLNFFSKDSVLNEEFENFQIRTPYKQLREQFQRQEKLFQKQIQVHELEQFDSFNQKNSQSRENNYYKQKTENDNKQNSNFNPTISQNKNSQRYHQTPNDSNQKKGFFFLTNPIQTSSKPQSVVQTTAKPRFGNYKPSSQDAQIKQFCFNLSQIVPHNQPQYDPYNNKNLFSNSNEQPMFLFDSKNASNQFGSQKSKKVHVKQLVQDFIYQLQHLDQGSLNQKAVNQLEDILQSIVFKDSKPKKDFYMEKQSTKEYQVRKENKHELESSVKKWQKHKTEQSPLHSTAKRRNQVENQNHVNYRQTVTSISQQRKQPVDPLNSLCKIIQRRNHSRADSEKSTARNSYQKQGIYKPNFCNLKKNSDKKVSPHKENVAPVTDCKTFTNLKKRQEVSPIKINPKSSIYFNKGSKSHREHLKTQTSAKSGWRVY